MQAKNAKDAAEAQADQIKRTNDNRELETAEQLRRERIKSDRTLSAIRARLASSGTDTNQGAPLAILGENVANIELSFADAARQSSIATTNANAAAAQTLYAGKQAYIGGLLSTAGQAAGSAATIGKDYTDDVWQGKRPDTFNLYPTRRA
jgi:hypothetical protein